MIILTTLCLWTVGKAHITMQNKADDKQISITCWNSRGLVASLPYLNEILANNDVVALSEHWLHSNRLNVLTEISQDFNVIARASRHADASVYGYKRGQGGVALLWRKTLGGASPITSLTHDRICGIRLQCTYGRILNVLSVYMPAPGSDDNFDEILDDLAEIVESMETGSLTMICGDFNGDVGHLGGNKSTRKPTTVGRKLMKFFKEYSLILCNMEDSSKGPLNTFRGGVGASTIDYVAVPTSLYDDVLSCEVLENPVINTSDHNAISIVMKFSSLSVTIPISESVRNVKWSKINSQTLEDVYTKPSDEFCASLLARSDISNMNPAEIDDIIDLLTSKLFELSEKLPKAKFRKHVRPFWNDTLTELKRVKVHAYRVWRSEGSVRDPNDINYINHKKAKRDFRREIKKVQRDYEKKQVQDLINSAECDRNKFWKLVKNARQTKQSNTISIKNRKGKVVHDIKEVVEAWRDHFSHLSKKKTDPSYDLEHYEHVTRKVNEWFSDSDKDVLLEVPFSDDEVDKAIKKLNKGKAAGCDSITAEHLQKAGHNLVGLLASLFRRIVEIEYIPSNLRKGTQIPLYKGKNTCTLDLNNYRGITLLTSLNKVLEVLLWDRMKDWWEEEHVISPLQGACRSGKSCLHSALTLQETISVGLGTRKRVLVTYLDVSKAFDGVWIDGLFYQLRKKGIVGRVWRMLYSSYKNFQCKVRIAGTYSDWYEMECGIHQGGVLSLLKYIAFIDPLLRDLEMSNLGCQVAGIPTSPVGYADDMSTACTSKVNVDKSLTLIDQYAKKWRYSYNAKKSAILVFGENRREHDRGAKYRNFTLGSGKVPELVEYDHVGIKNCLFDNTMPRTMDRISRGRRAFNAVASLGIKKNGINMSTCSTLFWSIIVPIVTYGCELWVLKGEEIEELRKFQRYIGRRCQRYPKRSPNYSAYTPLGWMSIDRVIQAKKMLFLRTMLIAEDMDISKQILNSRATEFSENLGICRRNEFSSPIYDILNTSIHLEMYDTCMRMIIGGCYYSKSEWKDIVWRKVWAKEEDDCILMYKQPHQKFLLFETTDKPYYITWWILADMFPRKISMCETMATLVCDSSLLKSSDYRIKKKSYSHKICTNCTLGIIEDIRHIVMQCPFFNNETVQLYESLEQMDDETASRVMRDAPNYFHIVMGKRPEYASFQTMIPIWLQTGEHISRLYRKVIAGRT